MPHVVAGKQLVWYEKLRQCHRMYTVGHDMNVIHQSTSAHEEKLETIFIGSCKLVREFQAAFLRIGSDGEHTSYGGRTPRRSNNDVRSSPPATRRRDGEPSSSTTRSNGFRCAAVDERRPSQLDAVSLIRLFVACCSLDVESRPAAATAALARSLIAKQYIYMYTREFKTACVRARCP